MEINEIAKLAQNWQSEKENRSVIIIANEAENLIDNDEYREYTGAVLCRICGVNWLLIDSVVEAMKRYKEIGLVFNTANNRIKDKSLAETLVKLSEALKSDNNE